LSYYSDCRLEFFGDLKGLKGLAADSSRRAAAAATVGFVWFVVRSRPVISHVLVLMIAAHDSVPAHFISPTKFGLKKPKDFGGLGVIIPGKIRDRYTVFTPCPSISATPRQQAGGV
jgi:hypothetical protein